MPTATVTPQVQPIAMQGIAIPAAIVDANEFRRRTRRHIQQEKRVPFTLGEDTSTVVALRRSDILGEVSLHVTGTLVVTPGSGSVASTWQWPYGLLKSVKFNANGTSSLLSARGWTYRARELAKDEGLSDRGVSNTIGGTTRTQGTLALACEEWGVGSATTGLASTTGTDVDFTIPLPVAEDMYDLNGAIFLQSASQELSVEINWANVADLFTLAGGGTVDFSGYVEIVTHKFEIPTLNGAIVVPDLSMFHSFVETSTIAISNQENEPVLVGQGAGKFVLRAIYQHINDGAPLAMTSDNFGLQGYRYGTSETPDQWPNGSILRNAMERQYNADLGGLLGFGVHEFAKGGFRDLLDMGVTSDLRLVTTINDSVTLTDPKLWYAVESVYQAGKAA